MPLNLRVRMQSRSLHTQSKSKKSKTLKVGWRRENIELLRTFTFNPGKKGFTIIKRPVRVGDLETGEKNESSPVGVLILRFSLQKSY
jgi:hypothetical protein